MEWFLAVVSMDHCFAQRLTDTLALPGSFVVLRFGGAGRTSFWSSMKSCNVHLNLWLGVGLALGTCARLGAAEVVSTPLTFEASDRVGFESKPAEVTGIPFINRLEEWDAAQNRVLLNGAGVALGDYDGDGRVDVYVCGLNSNNALYRNLGGWRFEDVTELAGVACAGIYCRGAVLADVNGDGRLDLLVTTVTEGTRLFINAGEGRFEDRTQTSGIGSQRGSSTLALADVDGNGSLDVYVTNYRPNDIRDSGRVQLESRNGKTVVPARMRNRLFLVGGQINEYGEPDQLFLNDGKGQFRAAQWDDGTFLRENGEALAGAPLDWGLSASFRDVNGDAWPDLYVCNDYWTPDRFWINQGGGVFRSISQEDWRVMSASSMGVDFADVNRDGALDFFCVDMLSRDWALRKRQKEAQDMRTVNPPGVLDRPQVMRNTLSVNRGDGSYAEVAHWAGVEASDWSWSPLFSDVDLDGNPDLLISAGHAWDVQDLDATRAIQQRQHSWSHIKDPERLREAFAREMMVHNRLYPKLAMPIVAFRNRGDGRFDEVTDAWGLGEKGVRHGMALGDLDNDGDLDLVANRLNGPLTVLENQVGAPRISVVLMEGGGRSSVGATVRLRSESGMTQLREVVAGGRYLSGADSRLVFAIPEGAAVLNAEIRWRDGSVESVSGLRPNRAYRITRGEDVSAARVPDPGDEQTVPLFIDVSATLGHRHTNPPFNEFVRQPLLPFERGRVGPGVSFSDLDGDGRPDLLVGGGQGQSLGVYFGDGEGGWQAARGKLPMIPTDMAGTLAWRSPDGQFRVLLAATGYERALPAVGAGFSLEARQLEDGVAFAPEVRAGGALALGDLRGNGTLVLFVGGGVLPGRYPEGADSKIYQWQNGRWVVDATTSVVLANLGIVNGAVWSDLNGDGYPELVLACEWGPVRVFENRSGKLFEATDAYGLAEATGWWQGVASVDLNGDGAMDLVVTNWGRNTEYRASLAEPLQFYVGELARPGIVDVIETVMDGGRGKAERVPSRQLLPLASSLPFLGQTFSSHLDYSEAGLERFLGARKGLARPVTATTLASTVFLNDGGRFRAVPLPARVQWAPATGICGGDFDGDGHEDVFIAQNFFGTRPGLGRHSAGEGQLLLGDGTGRLDPVPSVASGIRLLAAQQACAVADYDRDGRLDLAVTQNSDATVLLRNQGSQVGLRVHLEGPPGNPTGIGCQLRLVNGTFFGPAREISGGQGYLGQNDSVTVLHGPREGASVFVQWPGGQVTSTPVAASALEITVKR